MYIRKQYHNSLNEKRKKELFQKEEEILKMDTRIFIKDNLKQKRIIF